MVSSLTMMTKRRLTILLLGLVGGLVLLAACGASPTPEPTQLPPTSLTDWLGGLSESGQTEDLEAPSIEEAAKGSGESILPRTAPEGQPAPQQAPTETTSDEPPPSQSTDVPTSPSPEPDVIHYTVQPGDTLLGLALGYDVSMASIQLLNGMGDSIALTAGQELIIATGPMAFGEDTFWVVHVVKSGETLVGLGQSYELEVDEILRVNSVADPALINVGQKLVMPLTGLYLAAAPTPEPPAAVAAVPAGIPPTPQATEALTETETGGEETPVPTATPAPAPAPGPPAGEADWPAYILARINQARAENGLPGLSVAPELTLAAQAHAEDCAQRGWGSHVGSDGATLRTRLARVGYHGSNVGENWVQAQDAARGFDWWYGEIPPNDPHRRNILSPHYTEVGVGIAQTGWGYIFVTDFGRR